MSDATRRRRFEWRHRPTSTAARLAEYIAITSEADADLRTLHQWSRFLGVSSSCLRERCRMAGVRPTDAKDLARVLGALMKSRRARCRLELLLDVGDSRTLKRLLVRSGLDKTPEQSIRSFLRSQSFVPRSTTIPDILESFFEFEDEVA